MMKAGFGVNGIELRGVDPGLSQVQFACTLPDLEDKAISVGGGRRLQEKLFDYVTSKQQRVKQDDVTQEETPLMSLQPKHTDLGERVEQQMGPTFFFF